MPEKKSKWENNLRKNLRVRYGRGKLTLPNNSYHYKNLQLTYCELIVIIIKILKTGVKLKPAPRNAPRPCL